MIESESRLKELKKALQKCLSEEVIDNTKILSLTHEMASLDKSKVRFSVDAGVIDRLGQELVARQETAVSELVKNAYDADAEDVTLDFVDSDIIGGTLIIEDDGEGMDRESLVNGFMKISSTSKIHTPTSPKFNRQRAGQKGIGRFSVQRLGSKLTITTQTENSEFALRLKINWDDYVRDDNLLVIENELEMLPKEKTKGTTLVIDGLRDRWSKAAIQRVYRYVSEIIKPSFLSEHEQLIDSESGSFEVIFYKVNNQGLREKIADNDIMLYRHAVAEFSGGIDDKGFGTVQVISEKLKLNETLKIGSDADDSESIFPNVRDIKFRAYYFIYDSKLIGKMHSTSIRNKLTREGGMKLYRNGFRVLPYGEEGDDWLRLDESVRRRGVLVPHGNINLFGFVEFSDPQNKYNETSSREGLIDNANVRELKNFLHRAIVTSAMRVAASRKVKVVASQKEKGMDWDDIDFRIKNIALSLEELDREFESDGQKKNRRKAIKKAKKEVEELKNAHEIEVKKLIKDRSMLRVLSSVGITVSQFIHEIKYYMDNIISDVDFLLSELEGKDSEKAALATVKILKQNFSSFQNYTSYFNTVVSANLIRELAPLNIRQVVNSFTNSMRHDADRLGIELVTPKFNKVFLHTRPMHPSEWSSILFNFYTNSKKAIARAKSKGRIFIECGEDNGNIYLEFSDNGDGIKEEDQEQVFDEFFTTTSVKNLDDIDENTEVIGTGLGLKIVKDIIGSYKGNVELVSAKLEYSTCFKVEIRKATDKELDEYGL